MTLVGLLLLCYKRVFRMRTMTAKTATRLQSPPPLTLVSVTLFSIPLPSTPRSSAKLVPSSLSLYPPVSAPPLPPPPMKTPHTACVPSERTKRPRDSCTRILLENPFACSSHPRDTRAATPPRRSSGLGTDLRERCIAPGRRVFVIFFCIYSFSFDPVVSILLNIIAYSLNFFGPVCMRFFNTVGVH